MLLCHKGVLVGASDKHFQLELVPVQLTPFLYLLPSRTHSLELLSPHKELLSCSSKAIHPLPGSSLITGWVSSTFPRFLFTTLPPPGIKSPAIHPPLFVITEHLCVISPPVCPVVCALLKLDRRKSLTPGLHIILVFTPWGHGFNSLLHNLWVNSPLLWENKTIRPKPDVKLRPFPGFFKPPTLFF